MKEVTNEMTAAHEAEKANRKTKKAQKKVAEKDASTNIDLNNM